MEQMSCLLARHDWRKGFNLASKFFFYFFLLPFCLSVDEAQFSALNASEGETKTTKHSVQIDGS